MPPGNDGLKSSETIRVTSYVTMIRFIKVLYWTSDVNIPERVRDFDFFMATLFTLFVFMVAWGCCSGRAR